MWYILLGGVIGVGCFGLVYFLSWLADR